MKSIKPGRAPSAMGAVGGIIGVIFGIFWTILAYQMTHDSSFPDSPFPLFNAIFPLFGVLFVIIGIVNVIYNLSNATSKNRFSTWDITSSSEESDPLNDAFGPRTLHSGSESIESKLRKLNELKAKGLLSDAEYTAQRQRILNEI